LWGDKDPVGKGLSDTISVDKILAFSQSLLMDGSRKAARDRALFILALHSASRGDEMRNMRLMFFDQCMRIPCIGPCGCIVLPYRSEGEKQHAGASCAAEYKCFAPHRKVLLDPLVALGLYFMSQYTLSGKPFPDINDNLQWRQERVFPSDQNRKKPLAYNAHLNATKAVMEQHGIETGAKTHVFSRTGAQIADLSGASEHTMQRMGHWGQKSVMQKLYLMKIPPEGVLVAGGWPDVDGANYKMFYHPRFLMLPTESIIDCIFSFLGTLKKDIEKRKGEGKECTSQNNVAAMFDYLAVKVFQGSLHLVFTGEALDGEGVCSNPCFQRLMNISDFQKRLEQYTTMHKLGVS
jgi:hypothetical protein